MRHFDRLQLPVPVRGRQPDFDLDAESLDTSAGQTRQNAGSVLAPSPPRPPPRAPGCVKAPAATDSASVIVAPGSVIDASDRRSAAATATVTATVNPPRPARRSTPQRTPTRRDARIHRLSPVLLPPQRTSSRDPVIPDPVPQIDVRNQTRISNGILRGFAVSWLHITFRNSSTSRWN